MKNKFPVMAGNSFESGLEFVFLPQVIQERVYEN